jgi:MFS family permease
MLNICRIELLYTLIIMLGSMSFGLTLTFWSPAATEMSADLDLSKSLGTLFNVLAPVGSIFGGILAHFLSKGSRRNPLLAAGLVQGAGWVVIGLGTKRLRAITFTMRAVVGVSTGVFSTFCPLLITELAPTEVRGVFGTFNQIGIMAGMTLSYFWGIFFGWRTVAFILSVAPFLVAVFIRFVPESPAVERQVDKPSGSICRRPFVKPMAVSALLMIFQQWSGNNALSSNLESIFFNAGSSLDPELASLLVGLAGTVATGFASYLVERLGRRVCWMISTLGMCFSLFMAAVCETYRNVSRALPLVFLFLANTAFSIGLGPIPWFFIPELFPDEVRGTAMAIFGAVNWCCVALVVLTFPSMEEGMGTVGTFLLYALMLLFSFVFGFFLLPETKGTKMGGLALDEGRPDDHAGV